MANDGFMQLPQRHLRHQATAGQAGFTFVEMAVTLIVMAIVVAIAVPSYKSLVNNSNIRSTSLKLAAAINLARTQAVSLHVDAVLKPENGGNNWSNGWKVHYEVTTTDSSGTSHVQKTTRHWKPASSDNEITAKDSGGNSLSQIKFQANGFIAGQAPVFTVCDDRANETGTKITLQKNGKATTDDTYTCT